MRIAIVGNFALTGNQTMATRALPLARLLAARGHAVRMGLPVRCRQDIPGVNRTGGVEVHQVSCRLPFGPECYVLQAVQMLRLCLSWKPSVVYCFKPIAHSGAILAALLFSRRLGLFRGRLILDTDDWEGHGGWNEKQRFPVWVKALFAWQERWSLMHADVVVAASRELVRLAKEHSAKQVLYLPNCLGDSDTSASDSVMPDLIRHPGPGNPLDGVDGTDLGRARCPRSTGAALSQREREDQDPVVLVYTRFVEYSLERLVATFEAILRRAPLARFVVAGSGLNGEEEVLERMLLDHGLAERVSVLGWAEPETLPDLFASADVALYLLDDNLLNRTKCPMKLVELSSAGVPVVADGVGQAGEYVSDGETGVLVTSGDVEAMAAAAASLLLDPERRARMSSAARVRSARWRWSEWLPALERAFGSALA